MKPVSIAVLSEDGSSAAIQVLQSLVQKMLYLIDPAIPLHDPRRIRLLPSTEAARRAFVGSGWKSRAQRQMRVDLLQFMQSQLKRTDVESFVIFHVDGDRPYAQSKDGTESENRDVFEKLLMGPLRDMLQAHPDLWSRILLIIPFYEIEAWLYQNIPVAVRLCRQFHPTHTKDIKKLEDWQKDPTGLDEVESTKDAIIFRDKFNRELAEESFPAQRVYEAKKSFYKSVEKLRTCASLRAALDAVKGL